ncbi:coiled-coil domain-containing protein 22 homolog isoform X2 [Rhynchophorus ferrugineus]|uniref:Coiled-coil domain-containing protein 22 homolog n=1 Tax=Rhynchophorus ferrugineus TaxID=354439 RepID=A0A834HSP7_RHYFE|nr:hypothetical protein GWI33_019901 [Rhynchophorus ferrugineus]
MEEVDRIIIDSLNNIQCKISDEISNLKQFNPNLVLTSISTCLEIINPELILPKELPGSMSAKIKVASSIAEHIREMGFKGDMGYQTILYSNEIEVRRVLMFLIERLPKEASPIVTLEPTGYASRSLKEIQTSLRNYFSSMWLPTALLQNGTREYTDEILVNSFGGSCPVESINLLSSNIPIVTTHCTKKQLISSLLYKPADFSSCCNWKDHLRTEPIDKNITSQILENVPQLDLKKNSASTTKGDKENTEKNSTDLILLNWSLKKEELLSLQDSVTKLEEELNKIIEQNEVEKEQLNQSLSKLKIVNTTLAVLHNDDNKNKLRHAIEKAQHRSVELANQWNEIQAPLLEEHRSLKSSLSSENLKHHSDEYKYRSLKNVHKNLMIDFKEKSSLEQVLIQKCKELNNKNNRASYTERILEIVANIKKQDLEIQKILSDTRNVQKDINNLTGQVDRSFTLSDELIFFDCKQNETARKAYKLLAALREECNGILQAVIDVGQAEREFRNLEEQVETECNKEVKDKLEKAQSDLKEIQNEIKLLTK